MRRLILSLIALSCALAQPAASGTDAHTKSYTPGGTIDAPVATKLQLRGHLPELGETRSFRMFESVTTYDAFRNGLGAANIFPAASSLSMGFDRDILALFSAGNDVGGRCLKTEPTTDDAITLLLLWESGTCGAPISAHHPFILVSMSRTRTDGRPWLSPRVDFCAQIGGPPELTCTRLAESASPPSSTTAASVAPTSRPATPSSPPPTPSPVPPASPSISPSPVALATTQPVTQTDGGPNWLLVVTLVGFGFLVGMPLIAAFRARPRR